MNRQADHSIKGFLYQFLHTIKQVLISKNGELITCEGIEDIDVFNGTSTEAIQCKYHESVSSYSLGKVYHPILQMMYHFVKNPKSNVNYSLFAYFPNEVSGVKEITKEDCQAILANNNKKLKTLTQEINKKGINLDQFLKRFKFIVDMKFEDVEYEIKNLLFKEGFHNEEIESLIYPNLIYTISEISTKKNENERKITKSVILDNIVSKKSLLINKWILQLDNIKKLIDNKKNNLHINLNSRQRRRAFIFNNSISKDFNNLIRFISEFILKYHSSELSRFEPLFCVDLKDEEYNLFRKKIYESDLKAEDGFVVDEFKEIRFLRDPLIVKINKRVLNREFDFKLLNRQNINVLQQIKFDDYFVFSTEVSEFYIEEAKVENINFTDFNHINYIFQLKKGYE